MTNDHLTCPRCGRREAVVDPFDPAEQRYTSAVYATMECSCSEGTFQVRALDGEVEVVGMAA